MSELADMTLDRLYDEFDQLADWEEQCDFLIHLGTQLPPFPESAKTEANRVHGCQSLVWMEAHVEPGPSPVVQLIADSDSLLVRGLLAVVLTVYSGRSPREILATDIRAVFQRLGLDRHLSSSRRNGLFGMVQRVRALAEQAA